MKAFVIDVDGCLTDGQMWYSAEGKIMKAFGADDSDALKLIQDKIEIQFVSADTLGFAISQKRIADMGFQLTYVEGIQGRTDWIDQHWGLKNTIYMGDSFLDASLMGKVGYSICPADGSYLAKQNADYITGCCGGHRAVAEACRHIKKKFGL